MCIRDRLGVFGFLGKDSDTLMVGFPNQIGTPDDPATTDDESVSADPRIEIWGVE